MAAEKKTLKFQMMMSPVEAEELDDWMFQNRVRSRAEAIRRLCQLGLILYRRLPEFRGEAVKRSNNMPAIPGVRNISDIDDPAEAKQMMYKLLKHYRDSTAFQLYVITYLSGLVAESLVLTSGKDVDDMIELSADVRRKLDSVKSNEKEWMDAIEGMMRAMAEGFEARQHDLLTPPDDSGE